MTSIGRNSPCPCGALKHGIRVKFKNCCLSKTKLVPSAGKRRINGPAIMVLLPTRGRVTVETLTALNHMDGIATLVVPKARKGIVEARNELAKTAKNFAQNAPFQADEYYCLWADDDAFWSPGTITRAIETLQSVDIVAGWFSGRAELSSAKAFKEDGTPVTIGLDAELGNIVEVKHVGFHFVMHRASLLSKLPDNPFTITGSGTEDAAFCDRAREAGFKVWVDTALMVPHIDDDGYAYLPGCEAMLVQNGQLIKNTPVRSYGQGVDEQLSHA